MAGLSVMFSTTENTEVTEPGGKRKWKDWQTTNSP